MCERDTQREREREAMARGAAASLVRKGTVAVNDMGVWVFVCEVFDKARKQARAGLSMQVH